MDLFDGEIIGTDYAVLNQMWERMEQENPDQTILGHRMGTPAGNPRGDCPCLSTPTQPVSEGNSLALSSYFSTPTLELD